MKTTFLLVDDDLDNSELFCETLKEVDHSVICHITISGEDALHLLEEIRKPTLIFADVHMPGMNGWEFLQRLKSHEVYKHIPVIMHSSVANQKEIDLAYQSGAYAFLIKPRQHKELKRILRSLINKIKAGSLEPLVLQGICLNKGYDLKEL
jgi:CheY-like chemotaxis protein